MIAVTFQSVTAYLLDDAPSWDSDLILDAVIPTVKERGLSGRETRRMVGDTLRLEFKFTCLLTSSAAIAKMRNSLQALSTERVLCPLWPAGFAAGATPPVTAAYYALFNDDGSYDSIAAAAGLPFTKTAYPLMVGVLKETPQPELLNDSVAKVEFNFADSDIYPVTPAAFSAPNGLTAAGGTRPLFPFTPDWSEVPASGASEQDIERKQLGNLRAMAIAYYAQRSRRKVTQYFRLQNSEPFQLLRFFQDMGAERNNFWLGAALSEAALAASVASAATSLTVDNGAALGSNAFILLNDNANRVPLTVSSVASNTWNLAAAPGTAFGKDTTRIESLVLARFDVAKLSLNFSRPDLATAKVKFTELPWETNAVSGETYGTTMGALPVSAILFVFTLTTPSGTTTWRFTNFERDLTNSGDTYTSAPMECSDIVELATLERQSVDIKSRHFSGNPLSLLVPFLLEWPLMVSIIEADVTSSAASNLRVLFAGEVGKCEMEPPYIGATVMTLSSVFDRNIPRRLYQRTDNWILFESANGLVASDWQWNAQVVSYDVPSGVLVVNTITSSNGATLASHYFAAGYLIVTTGGVKQIRMIGDNSAPSAGQITIYLSAPLGFAPSAGDTVNLFPGYDGQKKTCIDKFNNYSHYGGFPFMPMGNPSVIRAKPNGGAGKK